MIARLAFALVCAALAGVFVIGMNLAAQGWARLIGQGVMQ